MIDGVGLDHVGHTDRTVDARHHYHTLLEYCQESRRLYSRSSDSDTVDGIERGVHFLREIEEGWERTLHSKAKSR